MNEELKFIKLIASRLGDVEIPYMLTGSMAMALYSEPRMTRDIDSVREAIQLHSMFNIIHNKWVIKADFIIKKESEYREKEFSRRKKIKIEDFEVYVVSLEDLIISKIIWGKESSSQLQFSDVKNLLEGSRNIDWEYLNTWGSALGISRELTRPRKDG